MMVKVDRPSGSSCDMIFKVLLLIFCLAMIVLFIYTGFISNAPFDKKIFTFLVSGGGMSGAFYLYMRWRIIELVILKGQRDPDSLDGNFLKSALSLIPGKKGKGENGNE